MNDEALKALDTLLEAFAGARCSEWEMNGPVSEVARTRNAIHAYVAALRSGSHEPRDEPWIGAWNNWIAPFPSCPRCGKSLDWKQDEDVFDNPMIWARCCVQFQAKLLWKLPASRPIPQPQGDGKV